MKKLMTGVALALVVSAAVAEEAKRSEKYTMTPQQMVEHRRMMDMKRFGGIVRKANSAAGKVVFLNAQKAVPAADLKLALDEIEEKVAPLWELKEVEGVKLVNPAEDIRKAGGKVGVVLAESPDVPALLVAPEAGWAVVNVTPLKEGANAEQLAHRVRVELLRAFALAGGCSFLVRDAEVLRPDIRVASDLDLVKEASYGVDARFGLSRGLPNFGVMPWKQASYRQACKEGWAPSPTNDVQKKIWDKVHAPPEKPMKITYDKDKQKPVVK